MDYLKISSIELYKSYKQASYSILSALVELIQNSINIFKQNNNLNKHSIILLYWDVDLQKIQIIDNSHGINQEQAINHLWFGFDQANPFNHHLISSCFYLGKKVNIESKNGTRAFGTSLDIENINHQETAIEYFNNDEILRIFNTGNRITIENLYHQFDLNAIHHFYKQLSFIFNKVLNDHEVSIIFSILKDGQFIDPSTKELTTKNNIANVAKLNFKLPEINNTKTISYINQITFNNKTIQYQVNAYQFLVDNNNLNGISISDYNRLYLIEDKLIKPIWFDEAYKLVYIDLIIDQLNMDLFNSKILVEQSILNQIFDDINLRIENLKQSFPKTFTKPLIDNKYESFKTKSLSNENETNEYDSLKESERFLTRAFNQTSRYGTFNDFEIIKDKLHFTYNADDGKKITINLVKTKNKEHHPEWLQLIPLNEDLVNQDYEYDLKINLNHPFFNDYINDKETLHKLEHFVICYAIAECITRLDGGDANQLKYEINKLLWGNEESF